MKNDTKNIFIPCDVICYLSLFTDRQKAKMKMDGQVAIMVKSPSGTIKTIIIPVIDIDCILNIDTEYVPLYFPVKFVNTDLISLQYPRFSKFYETGKNELLNKMTEKIGKDSVKVFFNFIYIECVRKFNERFDIPNCVLKTVSTTGYTVKICKAYYYKDMPIHYTTMQVFGNYYSMIKDMIKDSFGAYNGLTLLYEDLGFGICSQEYSKEFYNAVINKLNVSESF